MQLAVQPNKGNIYPLAGLVIKGNDVRLWLQQLHLSGISLALTQVYAIPGSKVNTIWGCLAVLPQGHSVDAGKNRYCQLVYNQLFIPEQALLFPALLQHELVKLLGSNLHFLHPETGLVTLEQPVNWQQLLVLPEKAASAITLPSQGVYLPTAVKSLQIQADAPEDTLRQLEQESFPAQQSLEQQPLNWREKLWLAILRLFFKQVSPKTSGTGKTPKNNWWQKIKNWFKRTKTPQWVQKLEQNYEALEERNKKQVDKLLEMFEKNPEEALKYAVPLDGNGSSRGGSEMAAMELTRRWNNWSLFDNASGTSGGAVGMADDYINRLRKQYHTTAAELIEKGNYEQAAFIYLKLLGEHQLAAATLEKGGLYAQAAAIYLTYCQNKSQAARCYESGNMLQRAIELYAETGQHEKAGDLCIKLNKRDDAMYQYGKVTDAYTEKRQYIKAAKIVKEKMEDTAGAQALLMKGWSSNHDAVNCLNHYFANIDGEGRLRQELAEMYTASCHAHNQEQFLLVLRTQYNNHAALEESIRNMAYEIVATEIETKPALVSELRYFNKEDKKLVKDILLFKQSRK